ncbi:MAG: hypothetical protein IJI54_09690 [Kiritimatiellae bacterium]|nr:hypothetical protein [Kiritimatiellia bacterium]
MRFQTIICCVVAAWSAAADAELGAVKESCRRQLGCCDERICDVIRFSEVLVGESDAAKSSGDEWRRANDERAARLVATQRDDGSWPDVDYVNMTRSMFNAVRHFYNMRVIARSPRTPEKERALHKALAFWLDGGFRNPNWWWNRIGVPLPLGTVALLMDDILSAEERARVVKALQVSKIGMTAQNRVWFATCVLYRALIEGNEADAKTAHAAILDEFKVSKTVEGIQSDWSFHQHGNQAQFGNYGASYISTMTQLVAMFNGTPWAVPDEKRQVLEKLVANGYMPIVWRGSLDMGALGRRIGPGVARTKGGLALSVAAALGVSTNAPAGLHWFPKSACGVYRGKGWMASVKCETASITGKERGNNDNLLGAHTADGALFTYVTGDEYRDVFPLWNWRHVPGITSYDERNVDWKSRNRSKVCVREGDSVRFVLDRAGLKATTVWRFSDAGVDVSVTEISSEKDKPVVTTVEQAIAQPGAKWWREKGGIVAVNGAIRYELPSNAVVRIEERTGSWKDSMEELSDEKVSGRVFEIVIPHGRRPAGASCFWRVMPSSSGIIEKWLFKVFSGRRGATRDHEKHLVAVMWGASPFFTRAF